MLAAALWLPEAPRKPHFLRDTQTGRAEWACDRQGCSRKRGSQGEVWVVTICRTWQRPNRLNKIIKLTQSVDTVQKI